MRAKFEAHRGNPHPFNTSLGKGLADRTKQGANINEPIGDWRMKKLGEISMLDQETLSEIDRISHFPFLSRVGEPYDGPHVAVKTWAIAEKKASSRRWEDFSTACINRLVPAINQARQDGASYDPVREDILARTKPFRDVVATIVANNSRSLSWPASASILLYYAIAEFHFRREVRPIFFWPVILPIFEAGRLVCGCNAGFLPLRTRQGYFDELPGCKLFVY